MHNVSTGDWWQVACSKRAVSNALSRLCENDLIRKVRGWHMHEDQRHAKAGSYELCLLTDTDVAKVHNK